MRCAALWYAQQKLHLVHKTAFPSHRLPFPGTVPGRSATARSVIYLRSGHGRAGAQVAAAAPRYAAPGTAEAPLRKRLPKPRLGEDTASPASGPRRQLLPPGSVPGGCCCRLPPPPHRALFPRRVPAAAAARLGASPASARRYGDRRPPCADERRRGRRAAAPGTVRATCRQAPRRLAPGSPALRRRTLSRQLTFSVG